MRVTAWHNIATDQTGRLVSFLTGYAPGHPLVPVASWDVPEDTNPQVAMEQAFALLNIGDDPDFGPPDERAVTYRAHRNRSLSIGDVVQVDQLWASVQAVGFTTIPTPTHLAIGASRHGTTSLPEAGFDSLTETPGSAWSACDDLIGSMPRAGVPEHGLYLDLNTEMLPEGEMHTLQGCPVRVVEHDYGAWVHVPPATDPPQEDPVAAHGPGHDEAWEEFPRLRAVLLAARRYRADWINLDADANGLIPGLPTFTW